MCPLYIQFHCTWKISFSSFFSMAKCLLWKEFFSLHLPAGASSFALLSTSCECSVMFFRFHSCLKFSCVGTDQRSQPSFTLWTYLWPRMPCIRNALTMKHTHSLSLLVAIDCQSWLMKPGPAFSFIFSHSFSLSPSLMLLCMCHESSEKTDSQSQWDLNWLTVRVLNSKVKGKGFLARKQWAKDQVLWSLTVSGSITWKERMKEEEEKEGE